MISIKEYRLNDKKETNNKVFRENSVSDVEYLLQSIPQLNKICLVRKKIGQGTFSKVYYGEARTKNKKIESLWAIKHIVPTAHPSRVLDEIACLKFIGGTENVIAVIHCLRNENHIALIMPYVHSDNFRNIVGKLKPYELCFYMQQLLVALKKVHSCQYIHRDVKPSNFLYSRSSDRCALIDFGLVQKTEMIPILKKEGLAETASIGHYVKRTRECIQHDEMNQPKRMSIDPNKSLELIPHRKLLVESPPRDSFNKKPANGLINGSVLDSPSKHTRGAEFTRKANELDHIQHVTNNMKSPNVQLNFSTLTKQQQSKPHCSIPYRPKDETSGYSSKLSLQQVRTRSGRSELRMLKNTCNCFGAARVCRLCLGKGSQYAHRSGTPGFRPPEVLLKHPNQTTAVDVWSAGVILLCLLSGRYPFFQAVDDCSALAEISTLLGTQIIRKTAEKLQKKFITSEEKPALSLFIVCESLRNKSLACHTCRKKNSCACKTKYDPNSESISDTMWSIAYPREFYDLLNSLLDPNPATRISASDALNHCMFSLYLKK